MKTIIFLMVLSLSSWAMATDYACRGIKGTKGAIGEMQIVEDHLKFVDSSNKIGAEGMITTKGNYAEITHFLNASPFGGFSVSVDLLKTGKGIASGYIMDRGHPGDYTTYIYFCTKVLE